MYTLFTFFTIVLSKTLLLTPKEYIHSIINVEKFAKEHDLQPLATFSMNNYKDDDITIYTINSKDFNTYSATFNQLFHVEPEQRYSVNDILLLDYNENSLVKYKEPWHLDRISKRKLELDGNYTYNEPGSCHKNKDVIINTYIIDTGIDIKHPEFEGRATWLANFADSKDADCNSHGTHCAGLVGSKTYGVCKDANLFAVKVLDCQGSGSTSGVIKGIDFAYKHHLEQYKKSDGKVRSIVSMSLGGGFSPALNAAVKATLKHSGFYFSAAAGNESQDSCSTSPASVKEILTVMASDQYDNRAYFSNFGKCSDIYSPGVDIKSTIPNGKTAVYSGTSMSTPNLVGVMNHYIDQYPELDMKGLKDMMLSDATKNHLHGNPKNTNNLLVYLHRED